MGNEWARGENSTKAFCKCEYLKKISIGQYKRALENNSLAILILKSKALLIMPSYR